MIPELASDPKVTVFFSYVSNKYPVIGRDTESNTPLMLYVMVSKPADK